MVEAEGTCSMEVTVRAQCLSAPPPPRGPNEESWQFARAPTVGRGFKPPFSRMRTQGPISGHKNSKFRGSRQGSARSTK